MEEYDLDKLTDLVFETNLSNKEMAEELGTTEEEVVRSIRQLGLSWVRRKRGHLSRGQAALTKIMTRLLPGEEIIAEYPLRDRLRLDVYCPRYQLAAEYHGRQHFVYTPFFHRDKQGFYDSQARDEMKEQICKDLGIALVVFRYTDELSEDAVYERLLDALQSTPIIREESKLTFKGNPYYENAKARQREYRRQMYRKMKAMRGRA